MLKKSQEKEKIDNIESSKKLSKEERRKIREKRRKETAFPTKMNLYLWFVLFFAGIVNFFDGWCTMTITLAMGGFERGISLNLGQFTNPDLFTYFDLAGSPVMMGIILSIAGIGVVASVSFKYLVDKYGRRPLTIWTAIAFTTFTTLTAFSPRGSGGLIIFLILRIFANYFLSADIVVIIMAEESPDHLRGRLLGMILAMGTIGGVACGIIQGTGITIPLSPDMVLTTWQSLFFLTSIGYFFIIPLFFFLKETKRFSAMKKYEDWRRKKGLESKIGWLAPLNKKYSRVIVFGCVTGFLGTLIAFAQITFFALYFAKELNMTSTMIGVASLPLLLAGGVGFFSAGTILDRWGRKPCIHRFGCGALVGGAIFSWPTLFVCGDIPNTLSTILVIAGGAFGTFSLTIMTTASVILTMEMLPTHIRSTASGWIGAISRGATILAPFLMMFGSETVGGMGLTYQAMFLLMGMPLTTILFTAYLLAPESKGRELEEIIASEIYAKQKVKEKKYKDPYRFFFIICISFFITGLIWGEASGGTFVNRIYMLCFYSGVSIICFILVTYVRKIISE